MTWMEQEGHIVIGQGLEDEVEEEFQRQADELAERVKRGEIKWP